MQAEESWGLTECSSGDTLMWGLWMLNILRNQLHNMSGGGVGTQELILFY